MSVCNPKPGSIIIKDGEILTVESIYENKFRTGAMGISTFTWQNIYQKKIWKFDVKLFSYLL